MLIRMKFNHAHPAVEICEDVHFFVLIRTGVIKREVVLWIRDKVE
jgi:hypothetical protein